MVTTREHWRIQKWAHENSATPAQIKAQRYDSEPAPLTFLFGAVDVTETDVFPITWEVFFAYFDLLQLFMTWEADAPWFGILKPHERGSLTPTRVH